MKDLTKDQLETLISWYRDMEEVVGTHEKDDELFAEIKAEYDHHVELESMDLSECEGGACKL